MLLWRSCDCASRSPPDLAMGVAVYTSFVMLAAALGVAGPSQESQAFVRFGWVDDGGESSSPTRLESSWTWRFAFPRSSGPIVRTVCPAGSGIQVIASVPASPEIAALPTFQRRAHRLPLRRSLWVGEIVWQGNIPLGVWDCTMETESGAVHPLKVYVSEL
jgi:hypothetical protein